MHLEGTLSPSISLLEKMGVILCLLNSERVLTPISRHSFSTTTYWEIGIISLSLLHLMIYIGLVGLVHDKFCFVLYNR